MGHPSSHPKDPLQKYPEKSPTYQKLRLSTNWASPYGEEFLIQTNQIQKILKLLRAIIENYNQVQLKRDCWLNRRMRVNIKWLAGFMILMQRMRMENKNFKIKIKFETSSKIHVL